MATTTDQIIRFSDEFLFSFISVALILIGYDHATTLLCSLPFHPHVRISTYMYATHFTVSETLIFL